MISSGLASPASMSSVAVAMSGSRSRSRVMSSAERYAISASEPACPMSRTIDRCKTAGRRFWRTYETASTAAS
jgi:hypothetical protein